MITEAATVIEFLGEVPFSIPSQFLPTDPEVKVRFPVLPDFLKSSPSGTGSTQSREYNYAVAWKKK
jgi:hypothetical protein